MRKKVAIIIVLCMCLSLSFSFSLTYVYAENEIYAVQLGIYRSEANALKCIDKMEKKGISAFKISTSVHCVFYKTYSSKSEALEGARFARKYMSGAYVVKLSEKQKNVYLKEQETIANNAATPIADGVVAPINNRSTGTDSELINARDSLYDRITEEKKQISIEKTMDNNLTYTYRVMEDIELRGINGESKWYFEVDKDLSAKSFTFNLFMRVNELIKKDISYVTVYMNNIPVKSMNFENSDSSIGWTIDIPTHLIQKGYNQLKIVTHSRISDSQCEDDRNIANWMIIDPSTHYSIEYERKYYTEKIANFPKPFVGLHADDDRGVGIIIPEDYTADEISAALTLIAYMRDSNLGYDTRITLVTSSSHAMNTFDSLIYIGPYRSMPENFEPFIKQEEALYKKDAHIYRRTLDDFRTPLFMIISDEGKNLVNAVKALKNDDLKAQMAESYMALVENIDINIKEKKSDDYLYLKELGLNGIEVQGRNQQFTSIGIKIPFDEILANEANVHLNIRYSDNLDFEKSMVSVYINGIPIGSHRLERDKRDLDSITFYIPEALRQSTYYDVRVVFDLIPSGIIDCQRLLASVPWAYIQEDSSFFLPNTKNPLMLLEDMPYPFSQDEDLDSITLVLPDKPKEEDLKLAGMFAELIGTGIKKNRGIIKAIRGDKLDEESKDSLIVFGTPQENSAIKTINSQLWFKYNDNFNAVLSNEKMELLPDYSKGATFIELKPSSFDDKKGILSITSLDKGSLIDATHYLYENKMNFLTGDAAIISKTGDLNVFRFQKDADRPSVKQIILGSKNMTLYVAFAGSSIVLLLIGLGFYWKKNKKEKNKEE